MRPHRGGADTDASLRTLDRILKVRDSSAARDLRMAYSDLIATVIKGNLAVERLPHSPELWRQWRYAKAELTKACRVARTLEYWTNVLTVPAAVAAVFMPVVAAVPILTWRIFSIPTKSRSRSAQTDGFLLFDEIEKASDVLWQLR